MKLQLSGHPRGNAKWPLLNRGSSDVSMSRGRNITKYQYKHAWNLMTTLACCSQIQSFENIAAKILYSQLKCRTTFLPFENSRRTLIGV